MRPTRSISVVVFFLSASLAGLVRAQSLPPTASAPWEGEVTGTNVYVRSGAGTSHYPTTKLNAGDRVLVLDEKFGWYRIVPPAKSFSYIDKALVERRPGTDIATVKQDRAFVRAGSHLVSRKSATQVVLSRGVQVEIIGEADGFYKIKPPHSAAVYISKQYVRNVAKPLWTGLLERYRAHAQPRAAAGRAHAAAPLDMPRTPQSRTPPRINISSPVPTTNQPAVTRLRPVAKPGAPSGTEPRPLDGRGNAAIADSKPIQVDPSITDLKKGAPTPPPQKTHATAKRKVAPRVSEGLPRIEADLKATMQQPPDLRNLESLILRYQRFAEQTKDSTFAQYAAARIKQLKNLDEIRRAKSRFAADAEEIDAYRAKMGAERMKIMRARAEAAMVKYDLEGELRRSYAFAPEKRRYRLVDPKRQATIAYVDVPVDVQEDVEHMIGRLVGIRVSGRRYSQAARIPIAVAASIVDLTLRNAAQTPRSPNSANNRNNSAELAKSTREASQQKQASDAVSRKTAVAAGHEDGEDR